MPSRTPMGTPHAASSLALGLASNEELAALNKPALKSMCKLAGTPTTGSKQDLVVRLLDPSQHQMRRQRPGTCGSFCGARIKKTASSMQPVAKAIGFADVEAEAEPDSLGELDAGHEATSRAQRMRGGYGYSLGMYGGGGWLGGIYEDEDESDESEGREQCGFCHGTFYPGEVDACDIGLVTLGLCGECAESMPPQTKSACINCEEESDVGEHYNDEADCFTCAA